MFTVQVEKFDFVKKVSTGATSHVAENTENWTLSYAALIRAALLVGRRSMHDVFYFGEHSKHELRWRSAMIRANTMLRMFGDDPETSVMRLVPSPAYSGLDGSEKGAVSYMIGIATGKIMAERECDVRWLMHLDVYSRNPSTYPLYRLDVEWIPNVSGRPDLVGQSLSGQWAVIEAKGRSAKSTLKLRLDAKQQTRKIKLINGQKPKWRLASIGQLIRDGFRMDIVDPVDPSDDAFDINIPPDLFMFLAYRPVFELLWHSDRETLSILDQIFVSITVPEVELTIGLKKDIFDALSRPLLPADLETPETSGASMTEIIRQSVANIPNTGLQETGAGFIEYSIGPDGTFVGLGNSWKLDPDPEPVPPLNPLTTAFANFERVEVAEEKTLIAVQQQRYYTTPLQAPRTGPDWNMSYDYPEDEVDAAQLRLLLGGPK